MQIEKRLDESYLHTALIPDSCCANIIISAIINGARSE